MSESDVWRAGQQTSRPGGDVDFGEPEYGGGLWPSQAFAVERVLRHGWRLLSEQPVLLLLCGTLVWFGGNLGTLVSLPAGVVAEVLGEAFGMSGTMREVVSAGLNLGATLLALPIQWFLITGSMRGIAIYLKTGEVSYAPLVTSVRPTLWVLLYQVLVMVVVLATMLVLGTVVGLATWLVVPVPFMSDLSSADLWWAFAAWFGVAFLLILAVIIGVGIPLNLGTLAVILDGRRPVEAMGVGWQAAKGARSTLVVLGIVLGVLSCAGCLLFCVGQIVAYAVGVGGVTTAWLSYARGEEELGTWAFFDRSAG